jgi:tetratricopeptide (TPR) repeat protein
MPIPRLATLVLLAAVATVARASGGGGGPPPGAKSADVVKAEKLIQEKKWDEAIQLLQRASEQDSKNADIYNWLGYAERNRGNTDAAFGYYDKALKLDPGHRGAHEYVGEAYLMVGKPDKAKEHLAALEKLCGTHCEEYEDLKKDIDEYAETHKAAAK